MERVQFVAEAAFYSLAGLIVGITGVAIIYQLIELAI